MTAAPIHLAGERLMLDPCGCIHWPAQRMLILADLHFEKGSSAALRGDLLPPYDTRETLELLAQAIRRYAPRQVVALGDSFHDRGGAGRLLPGDHARLSALAGLTEFIWVLGNHDPVAPASLPGVATEEHRAGPLVFRHQARPGRVSGELTGHFHPKASVEVRGARVSRPCFVADGYRILLPALGAYTGGLDVTDDAVATLFPRGGRVFLLGRERLFSFPYAQRRPGRPPAASQAPCPIADVARRGMMDQLQEPVCRS
jgi:DNA ligase-associated metallophosphoesterase